MLRRLPNIPKDNRGDFMNKYTGARFQRTNLVVADIDRALRIYRDVLGLTVDFIKDSDESSYSYPVFGFSRDANLRFCVLSAGPQQRIMALTEMRDVPFPDIAPPRVNATVFEVPDVDMALAGLHAEGVTVFEEERLVTQDGRVGREIGFLDHDGHLGLIYRITSAAESP